MENQSLRILVCYYKDLLTKPKDPQYFHLQCGVDSTGVDLGIKKDNTGENISLKNKYWSEITGLYWAWRNLERTKYIGLCSYRRYFNFKQNPTNPIKILPLSEVEKVNDILIPDLNDIFDVYDIIVPQPYTYAYNFDKICRMNYNSSDFNVLKESIHNISPEYDYAYDIVFNFRNKLLGHNMFIMKLNDYEEYCAWVFPILLDVEKRIDPTLYSVKKVRVFGYMHEILLSVFIERNKMRPYYSQLTWFTDDSKGFKFNSFLYRIIANLYFRFTNRILTS